MKTLISATLAGLAVVVMTASGNMDALAQDSTVQSLRGQKGIAEDNVNAADLNSQLTGDRFERNYRQQPPLVPHKISQYQIDIKANQCITCHDWPQNTTAGAPKISETHYIGREGERLNHVSTARWFCIQCHVPQVEAKALVPNTFESAVDIK